MKVYKKNYGFDILPYKKDDLPENVIELTLGEIQEVKEHKKEWCYGALVKNEHYGDYLKQKELAKQEKIKALHIKALRKELKQIQDWFTENDWKINKVVIGEWAKDDYRWLDYLQERKEKRARQDEINEELA